MAKRSGNDSSSFDSARNAKNDEFYTQLADIEKKMRFYRAMFKGKTIFCNCDDPYESNFVKFFAMNFNFLGIKKLIATCYIGSPIANRPVRKRHQPIAIDYRTEQICSQ